MPYSPKQIRLFQAIKHGKIKRKGISKGKAAAILAEAGQSNKSGHEKRK